jgi:DNA-binding PadR family transcriptional regulator
MAATETRLLVLGCVSLFEPVNGYQIRRELMSWEVDRWAHIHPGSIYSALSTLEKQGHVRRHDLVDASREVAVYTTTDSGRRELGDLLEAALRTVAVLDPLPLHAALSMCPLLDRPTVASHLAVRVEALAAHLADLRGKRELVSGGLAPPHVARLADLQVAQVEVELGWVREVLAEVRAGALSFVGEPMGWRPAADDLGWTMAADRERYRTLPAAR